MKPGQRQTAIAWGVFALVVFLAGLGLLAWEFYAAAKWGADATLSVVFQTAWAHYPWTIFIVGILAVALVFFLLGHFVAQNRDVYDRLRKGGGGVLVLLLLATPSWAAAHYTVEKRDGRWVFVAPDGQPHWLRAVYAVVYTDNAPAKYGPSASAGDEWKFRWRDEASRRLLSWGFNAVGPYAHFAMRHGREATVVPPYPGDNAVQPDTDGMPKPANPAAIPYIHVTKPASYAARGGILDLGLAYAPIYGWHGVLPDVFDPRWEAYVADFLLRDQGLAWGSTGNPWMLGIMMDDSDALFGFGPGPEPKAPRLHPHVADMVRANPGSHSYKVLESMSAGLRWAPAPQRAALHAPVAGVAARAARGWGDCLKAGAATQAAESLRLYADTAGGAGQGGHLRGARVVSGIPRCTIGHRVAAGRDGAVSVVGVRAAAVAVEVRLVATPAAEDRAAAPVGLERVDHVHIHPPDIINIRRTPAPCPAKSDGRRRIYRSSGGAEWATTASAVAPADQAAVDDAFLAAFAERYFSTVAAAIRKRSPGHLVISPDLNKWGGVSRRPILEAAGRYCDVIQVGLSGPEQLAATVAAVGDKPLITWEAVTANEDSAFKGAPPSVEGIGTFGQAAATQAERGKLYAEKLRWLAQQPNVAGIFFWAWTDHRGERTNFGLVDLADEPYAPFVAAVTAANAEVARLLEGGATPGPVPTPAPLAKGLELVGCIERGCFYLVRDPRYPRSKGQAVFVEAR